MAGCRSIIDNNKNASAAKHTLAAFPNPFHAFMKNSYAIWASITAITGLTPSIMPTMTAESFKAYKIPSKATIAKFVGKMWARTATIAPSPFFC